MHAFRLHMAWDEWGYGPLKLLALHQGFEMVRKCVILMKRARGGRTVWWYVVRKFWSSIRVNSKLHNEIICMSSYFWSFCGRFWTFQEKKKRKANMWLKAQMTREQQPMWRWRKGWALCYCHAQGVLWPCNKFLLSGSYPTAPSFMLNANNYTKKQQCYSKWIRKG